MLQNKIVFAALSILSVISFTLADQPPIPVPNLASKKEKQKSEKLPPCKSCKNLASSFRKVSKKNFFSLSNFSYYLARRKGLRNACSFGLLNGNFWDPEPSGSMIDILAPSNHLFSAPQNLSIEILNQIPNLNFTF